MAHQKISRIDPEKLLETARANEAQFIQKLRDEKKRDTKLGLLTQLGPALQEWRGKGYSHREIAALLGHSGLPVSPQTVKAAIVKIAKRNGAASRPQTIQSGGEVQESKPAENTEQPPKPHPAEHDVTSSSWSG